MLKTIGYHILLFVSRITGVEKTLDDLDKLDDLIAAQEAVSFQERSDLQRNSVKAPAQAPIAAEVTREDPTPDVKPTATNYLIHRDSSK